MTERHQKLLFAILGVSLLVLLVTRGLPLLLPGGVDPQPRGPRVARGAQEPPVVNEVVELHLAALEKEAAEFRPGRDPWRFVDPSPPQPRGPRPGELATARRAEAEARQRLEEESNSEPAPPPLPPVDMRYLGSFGSAERRIAVFSDGSNIYNAMLGDTVDGRFVVEQIGYESVDLKYVERPEAPAQRLPIGG